jgi:hypothetical protein
MSGEIASPEQAKPMRRPPKIKLPGRVAVDQIVQDGRGLQPVKDLGARGSRRGPVYI